jgi:hypothetical protein
MTWQTPRTWVTNEVVTRAKLEPELYDNFLEVLPAKAAAAGDTFYRLGPEMVRVPIGPAGAYYRGPLPGWSIVPGGPFAALAANPVGDTLFSPSADNQMQKVTLSSNLSVVIPPSGQIIMRASAYASVSGSAGDGVQWSIMEDFGGGTVIEQPNSRVRVHLSASAQERRFEIAALMDYTPGTTHAFALGVLRPTGGTCQVLYGDNGTDTARGPVVLEAWAVA